MRVVIGIQVVRQGVPEVAATLTVGLEFAPHYGAGSRAVRRRIELEGARRVAEWLGAVRAAQEVGE